MYILSNELVLYRYKVHHRIIKKIACRFLLQTIFASMKEERWPLFVNNIDRFTRKELSQVVDSDIHQPLAALLRSP